MKRAWLAVLILTGLSLTSLYWPDGKSRLKVDASAEALATQIGKTEAGRLEPIELMAMISVPNNWTSADVRAVAKLTRKIQRLPGVIKAESPITTRIPLLEGDVLNVATLVDRLNANPNDARRWIDLTFNEFLLKGHMTNSKRNAIAMVMSVKRGADEPEIYSRRVIEILKEFAQGQERFRLTLTGATIVQDVIGKEIMQDIRLVLILSALIIPIVLFCSFKGIIAVILPMISIVLALLWTFGGMALAGISINLVTSIVPPLVIALTLAYSMHALYALCEEAEAQESIVQRLVMPLSVTGITTLAGFLALSIQTMPAIRDFSFAGGMGVLASLLSVLLVQCFGMQRRKITLSTRPWLSHQLLDFSIKVHRLVVGRRRLVIMIALAVFVIGSLGALNMEPGVRYIRDLPRGHALRDDFDRISETFGGANNFEIVIEGAGQDAVLLPSVLRSVNLFQMWLESQPEVGGTMSLVDYVKRLNQAFTSGEQKDFRVPDDFNLIKQLLIIGSPSESDRYANLDYSKMIIRVRTPVDDVAELRALMSRIETQITLLPTGIAARLQGNAVTLTRTVNDLTTGQILSLGMAILAIYLVISAVFASWRMGLRAMLPNLLPIAVYYGLIGLIGISLSPTMALVACIVLGIAVDDTLFYLVRFNRSARRTASEAKAAEEALKEVIGPVTLTTIALCLCFLTMTTSQFESQYVFAVLAAFTLLVAWFSDLTLTPAIGARSSIVTLWDVVSVDLGTAPEQTIPLFEGMTPRQARVFALLCRLEEIQAGECFIRVGDPAGDIYVIIEGDAYAWFDKDGQQIRLADFKRGNTFGEASTFTQHRTANVSAESDLRVLAFDARTLDRIRQRYPRVAALIYRNLSAIQAARLDRTTRKLEEMTSIARAQAPASA